MRNFLNTLRWAAIPTSLFLLPDVALEKLPLNVEVWLVAKLKFKHYKCAQCGGEGIAFPTKRLLCNRRRCFIQYHNPSLRVKGA